MRIGVLVDEGIAERDVREGLGDDRLTTAGGDSLEISTGSMPINEEGTIEIDKWVDQIPSAQEWDKLIYVTDLPMVAEDKPLVSRVSSDGSAVLLSTPSFGAVRAQKRLNAEILSFAEGEGGSVGKRIEGARVLAHPGRSLRLIAGMVRANQPGRLLPVLKGSLAAMAASGGFGVFYGSIWNLSEAMSAGRHLVVALVAVLVMSGWLIVRNDLWIRPSTQDSRVRARIDNTVTVITIASTVVLLFISVAIGMAGLSWILVPHEYLAEQISAPANVWTYVKIGWLSAALGTFAGAIGSNFDHSVEIRSATYSQREFERRQKVAD